MSRAAQNGPDILEYIEALLTQLQPMAATGGYETLAHLLDMARIEAHDQIAATRLDSNHLDGRGDKSSGVAL